MVFKIQPEMHKDVATKMPKFLINFSGPTWNDIIFPVNGINYTNRDTILEMESLHIYGKKDEYNKYFNP